MNEEKPMRSITGKMQNLRHRLGEGVRIYAVPFAVCLLITSSAVGMNLFAAPASGIDALFSTTPWFQCLWVMLAFSFFASALALRLQKRIRTIALYAVTPAVGIGWFVLATVQKAGSVFAQFELFRILLIVLFYVAALSVLPCGDGRNFSRFIVDAAAQSIAAFCGVTIIFIGFIVLFFAVYAMFGDVKPAIIPNIASILYGIVLPLLMAGTLVPKSDYPPYERILRGFVAYGLLPILASLGMVFYVYLAKILVTGIWPSNEVAPYVIFGSCTGAMFIVFFCGGDKTDRVSTGFCRFFPAFWLLPPVMLFVCAGMRIHQHGMTPMRALLLLFGIWMGGILLWMLLRRDRFHPKALPIFAAILLFASLFLPVGNIFSLSRQLQLARLDRALADADMGTHDSICPNADATDAQKRIILSATDYLLNETNAVLLAESGEAIVPDERDRQYGFSNIPMQESSDMGLCIADDTVLNTTGTCGLIRDLYLSQSNADIDLGYVEGVGYLRITDDFTLIVTNADEETRYSLRQPIVQAVHGYLQGQSDWHLFDVEGLALRVVLHEVCYETNADGSMRLCSAQFDLLILAQE